MGLSGGEVAFEILDYEFTRLCILMMNVPLSGPNVTREGYVHTGANVQGLMDKQIASNRDIVV